MRRRLEKTIATASFIVAVTLAFTSLILGEDHDIAANVCLVIAQFLTLTATLLGIDYKFTSNDGTTKIAARNSQQQPAQPTQDNNAVAGQSLPGNGQPI